MKHCISIADLGRDDVELVLERAASFRGNLRSGDRSRRCRRCAAAPC